MYAPNTTAGKGIKWEWLSLTTSEWNIYNMDVQNIIEDAWSKVNLPIILYKFMYIAYILQFENREFRFLIFCKHL